MNRRLPILALALFLAGATGATAQTSTEQEVIQLSKNKWQWMADKDVAKLEPLFHEQIKVCAHEWNLEEGRGTRHH